MVESLYISPMKMRILQVNTARTWRGGERQTYLLLQGFQEAGVEVSLLCLKFTPLYEKAKNLSIPVIGVRNQLSALIFLLLNGKKYTILHAQTARAFTLLALTKPFHRRKLVYTRRVDFVPSGFLTRLKYRSADGLVGISDAICSILRSWGFRNTRKITSAVLPYTPDHQRARQFLEKLPVRRTWIIGTTAALVEHKDPLTLVEAVKRLWHLRQDFLFLHFGEGHLREAVEERIHRYGLQDVILLCGYHEKVEDFFSIFQVFVMSSQEEGLGSSVLDAFYHRVPVVATAAGGLKELVEGRGILCPVGDAGCLAEGIHHLLESPALREDMVSKAYEYVMKNHSLQSIIADYLELYNQLMERP